MRRNVFILSIQQRSNIQRRKRKTAVWVYPRPQFWFKDLAEEPEKFSGVGGIVNRKKGLLESFAMLKFSSSTTSRLSGK